MEVLGVFNRRGERVARNLDYKIEVKRKFLKSIVEVFVVDGTIQKKVELPIYWISRKPNGEYVCQEAYDVDPVARMLRIRQIPFEDLPEEVKKAVESMG